MNKLNQAENAIKNGRWDLMKAIRLLHSIKNKNHKKYLVLCGFDSLDPNRSSDWNLFNVLQYVNDDVCCEFKSYNNLVHKPLLPEFWFSKLTAEKFQAKYNIGKCSQSADNRLSANNAKIFSYSEFVETFGPLFKIHDNYKED